MRALQAFMQQKRQEHHFLRVNGAVAAADRGDTLLDELQSILLAQDVELSVQEAAKETGVHEESIRRKIRKGDLGSQTKKSGPMRVKRSELIELRPHRKKEPVAGAYDPALHAARIASQLGRR